jgi:1-deoxy-D-xylulose-5-phosphate reductoisomerase
MGPLVTVNSATLMNKGLELIEAFHLFQVGVDRLAVVVHPESIIHALVSYTDGSVLAQLGAPDMRSPIAVALAWPQRIATPVKRLDLIALKALHFEAPDEDRFPALALARAVMSAGGTAPAILNAANEIAVEAFLSRRISFPEIAGLVGETLEAAAARGLAVVAATLDDVLEVDAEARRLAAAVLDDTV